MNPTNPTNRPTDKRANGQTGIPICIKAGWLIDGSGGAVRRNVVMEIEGDTIGRIDEEAGGSGPEFRCMDFSGCTVLPGLFDCHVHLFMSGTTDLSARKRQLSEGFHETRQTISRHLRHHLHYGIAAVRDGGDHDGMTLRYREECLDRTAEPVVVRVAGRAWHRKGRYGRLIGDPPPDGRSLADAIGENRHGVDVVKIVNSGLNSLVSFGRQTPFQFDRPELTGAAEMARRLGLGLMVHANGEAPVRMAVEAGCRSIEHGFFMGRENLKRMAEQGTFWVPTACTMKAYADHMDPGDPARDVCRKNLEHQLEQLRTAREMDVPVALGTDAGSLGVHHGRAVAEELGLLMEAGYPVHEAVRCATSNGAILLETPDMGRLAAGGRATFIVVPGNPAGLPESLHRIETVCIGGRFGEEHPTSNLER